MRERSRISVKKTGGYARLLTYYVWERYQYGVHTISQPYSQQVALGSTNSDVFFREYMSDVVGNKKGLNAVVHSTFEAEDGGSGNTETRQLKVQDGGIDRFGQSWWFKTYKYTRLELHSPTPMNSSNVSGTTHVPLPGAELHRMVASIVSDAISIFPPANLAVSAAEIVEVRSLFEAFGKNFAAILKTVPSMQKEGMRVTVALKRSKGKKITAKESVHAVSGSYVAYQWGVKPLLDDIETIKRLIGKAQDRLVTLIARSHGAPISRRCVLTTYDEGTGVEVKTTHTLSCKMLAVPYINDVTLLLSILSGSIVGLGRIVETIWQLVPLSFAVDALAIYTDPLVKQCDAYINSYSDLINSAISMPGFGYVTAADWMFSSKTTARAKQKHTLSIDGESRDYFTKWKATQYNRNVYDLSGIVSSAGGYGMDPRFGLVGTLGALFVHMRT